MTIKKQIEQEKKQFNDNIEKLIKVSSEQFFNDNPKIKKIEISSSSEYNDEGSYDTIVTSDVDSIKVNGYSIWDLEEDNKFLKKTDCTEKEFNDLCNKSSETFEQFNDIYELLYGNSFTLIITKDKIKITHQ